MLIKSRLARAIATWAALFCLIFLGASYGLEQTSDDDREPQPQFAPTVETGEASPFGFVPQPIELDHITVSMPLLGKAFPSRFDWRQYGKVTSVKNQGSCGSCYAFAALGNFESKVLIDAGMTYDFSENSVKECEWYGSSCNGGNYFRVANFLSQYGTVLESCDPYIAGDVDCKLSCPYVKVLKDWSVVSSSQPASVDVIKAYLQTYGPLYTTMYAGNGDSWYYEFQSYNGSYTLYYNGSGSPNHAVLIVGWDDALSHAGGQGAWIVKNSWGTNWGGTCGYGTEKGYFTIAYGSAKIGSNISFLKAWRNYDAASKLLYHDEGGFNSAVGYGNTTAWGLCKFVPTEPVEIRSVEVWVLDAAVVDIYIYDNFSNGTPSGLLASKVGNSIDLPGYYSIDLASPIMVSAGDDIFVVAKITDQSYNYPLAFDGSGPISYNSYISWNGSYFTAFGSGDLGIRVRALTTVGCGSDNSQPNILSIRDVPNDNGGYVEIRWARSGYDRSGSSPRIQKYKIWRKRNPLQGQILGSPGNTTSDGPFEHGENGPAWELVATIPATGACNYTQVVPTLCDSTAGNPCLTYFYVSAVTGEPGEHYDSDVVAGYSKNNGAGASPSTSDAKEIVELATVSRFSISPNPARSNFNLEFDVKERGRVIIDLYDVMGRKVGVVLDGAYQAGRYEVSLEIQAMAYNLAPGVYFFRISGSDREITRKLVLTR